MAVQQQQEIEGNIAAAGISPTANDAYYDSAPWKLMGIGLDDVNHVTLIP